MNEKKDTRPFSQLGSRLKSMREGHSQSLAEVSGAVEIDSVDLARIERGEYPPSEDVLLLLISHFAIKEDEALKLWELAGYSMQKPASTHMINTEEGTAAQSVMISPSDLRIVYTDMVHVMVNNYGVVINFMQGSGLNMQPLAVSRVGMSKEHAKSIIEVLQKTLEQAEKPHVPKQLSSGNVEDNKTDKK